MRNTDWFDQMLKKGTETENKVEHLLTDFYKYEVKNVADIHLGWDLEISIPDSHEVKALKADVKRSASWLNVGIGFSDDVALNSPADIYIYFNDTNPNDCDQYLFLDTEALKELPRELAEKRWNQKQEKYFWFVSYKVLKNFCREKGYLFTYRQLNF